MMLYFDRMFGDQDLYVEFEGEESVDFEDPEETDGVTRLAKLFQKFWD